jgi:hypothetical protein
MFDRTTSVSRNPAAASSLVLSSLIIGLLTKGCGPPF